ncbi:protein kinase domain protein [Penicillium herquei]|nr:protein kinase domain protein [Penicillium herquei]
MIWLLLQWVWGLIIVIWIFARLARPSTKKPNTYPPIPIESFKFHTYGTFEDTLSPEDDDLRVPVEEEESPHFKTGLYYPVTIGEVLGARYQVLRKVGWTSTSTVWFGRDLFTGKAVSLKVHISGPWADIEFRVHEIIRRARSYSWHEGAEHIQNDALDLFLVRGAHADYWCIVQHPLMQGLTSLQGCFHTGGVPSQQASVKNALKQVLRGLDFLHRRCRVVHTDIKAENIIEGSNNTQFDWQSILASLQYPCTRIMVNKHPVYLSTPDGASNFEKFVICEFGAAVLGDHAHNMHCGTDYYQAPEVMFQADWTYPIDIWSFGITVWNLVQGNLLFDKCSGIEEVGDECHCGHCYDEDSQVAEIFQLLGPPPVDILKAGSKALDFFDPSGRCNGHFESVLVLANKFHLEKRTFESVETILEGEEKALFLDFIRGMIQWRPEDRKTAAELLKDPWLNS